MNRSFLFLVFISLFAVASGQKFGSVEGIVYDSVQNEGIMGAAVTLLRSDLGAVSDADGRFSIASVPAGEDILQCTLIGYGKTLRKALKGKVHLGGCIVTHCDPRWYCKRCKVAF